MMRPHPHFDRHPSESWGPASPADTQRDASFRWHDGNKRFAVKEAQPC